MFAQARYERSASIVIVGVNSDNLGKAIDILYNRKDGYDMFTVHVSKNNFDGTYTIVANCPCISMSEQPLDIKSSEEWGNVIGAVLEERTKLINELDHRL